LCSTPVAISARERIFSTGISDRLVGALWYRIAAYSS